MNSDSVPRGRPDQAAAPDISRRNPNHGDVMRPHLQRMLPLVLVLVLTPTALAAQAAEENETAAVAAAESWLQLTDSSRYAEGWTRAAASFRGAVTAEQWEAAARQVIAQTGPFVKRSLRDATYTTTLPNLPSGEYVVVEYESTFASVPSAVETVILVNEGAPDWRVMGYFVRPE